MDRAEVLEQMAPILSTTARAVDHGPGTKVLVADGGALALRTGTGARSRVFTEEGRDGLYRFLGLERLAPQLEPATRAKVATELLEAKGRYTLLLQDDQVTDVAPDRKMTPLNPERVIDQVGRTIPEADFSRVLLLPHHIVSLDIVAAEEHPVVRGDLVRAGASVLFSPLGFTAPMVSAYTMRLACMNGATATDYLSQFQFHGGHGEDGSPNVWAWFRQSARDAVRAVERVVVRYRQLAEQNIAPEDRAAIIEAMLREAGLHRNRLMADGIRALAIEQPPQTEWDAFNLLTQAASHMLTDGAQVIRARSAAARFASETEHRRLCPSCRRPQ